MCCYMNPILFGIWHRTRRWECVGKLCGHGMVVAEQRCPGVETDGFISIRRLILEQQPTTTSRRAFLKAMAGAAGVLVLAACGGSPSPSGGNSAEAPTAEPAAAAGATAAPAPAAAPTAAPAAAAVSDRVLVNPQIDTTGIKKGGTIIRGDVTDVRTLNPLLVSDTASGEVTSLMFDGLVDIDPDSLDAVQNLAVKWDVSADNKTYTFTLKDGVKWHDGQPFTADDAKFSYDLYMNPDTGTPRAGTLKDRIATVEA